MEFKDLVKNRRSALNMSMEELGKKVGVSKATVQRWESGEIKNVRRDKISKLADALNTTPAYLMGWNNQIYAEIENLVNNGQLICEDEVIYSASNISFIKVPLYGDISCGNGAFVDDNIVDYVAVPNDNLNPKSEYFAQRAKGDSMINAGIDDGDIIVFEKVNTIDDNKIGCFCIDESMATCKRFKRGSSYIQLIPANQNYDPIVVDLESTNFRILGKLRKVIKEFD